MEPTRCSETSAFNTQAPGKYPEDNLSIERSPFFFRRGGHCCRGNLVGRTDSWIFFWVACRS